MLHFQLSVLYKLFIPWPRTLKFDSVTFVALPQIYVHFTTHPSLKSVMLNVNECVRVGHSNLALAPRPSLIYCASLLINPLLILDFGKSVIN
jgi:hypothetical protein